MDQFRPLTMAAFIEPKLDRDESRTHSLRLLIVTALIALLEATPSVAQLPPAVVQPPQSQFVALGSNATFSVLVEGTPPLAYAWKRYGFDVKDGTNSTLVVSNVQSSTAGDYSLLVTNNFGAVTSSIATLTMGYVLTLHVTGSGSVVRSPARDLYLPNSPVRLTANPGEGYAFKSWSGNVTGTANPRNLFMTGHKSITANFSSTAVIVAVAGEGSVMKSPDKAFYAVGEQVTLTAASARWFSFASWEDGPTVNPRVITVNVNNDYVAIFSPITALETLTFGSVSRKAPVGMPVIFVDGEFAITDPLPRFGHAGISMQTTFPNGTILFTLDGTPPTPFSSLYGGPFILDRTRIIRAVAYDSNFVNSWEADPITVNVIPTYSLSATTAGGGSISVLPTSAEFETNTVATVTATPDPGWSLLQWLGDAEGSNPVVSVLMNRDRCLEAVFGTTFATAASATGDIKVEPRSNLYPYGWNIKLTAVPRAGNAFAVWGGKGHGTNNPLMFQIKSAAPSVSALFGVSPADQSSLTIMESGGGSVEVTPSGNRYTNGQTVALHAVPEAGDQFLGWGGLANRLQNPLYLILHQDTMITATFTKRPRVSISDCGNRSNGDPLRIVLSCALGDRLDLEVSSNLFDWLPDQAVTNLCGRVQLDLPLAQDPSRFYRAVLVP